MSKFAFSTPTHWNEGGQPSIDQAHRTLTEHGWSLAQDQRVTHKYNPPDREPYSVNATKKATYTNPARPEEKVTVEPSHGEGAVWEHRQGRKAMAAGGVNHKDLMSIHNLGRYLEGGRAETADESMRRYVNSRNETKQ